MAVKLTKSVVDRIEPPTDKNQALYQDSVLSGFALRVTKAGVKSFVINKRIKGKPTRFTLGRYGALTVEQARIEAQKKLGDIACGLDPVAEKRTSEARQVTLQAVMEEYLTVRKGLKAKTAEDYRRVVQRDLKDWSAHPMASISKDAVAKRHARLGKSSPSRANTAMRVLRALFRFAKGQYEDAEGRSLFPENPVDRLNHTRAWYPNKRRKTVITHSQLPGWYQAVLSLKADERGSQADTVADFLRLLLFTGLRKSEGLRLTWKDVDFSGKTLALTDTKNHEPLTLPLSDYLIDLLAHRYQDSGSLYVFPGEGEYGHLIEARKQMLKVTERSGVEFCLHDLRRTFITVAESLDLSVYAIKRLVNHKMNSDVTAGYIVSDVGRLREPMQRITNYLRSVCEPEDKSRIILFPNRKAINAKG